MNWFILSGYVPRGRKNLSALTMVHHAAYHHHLWEDNSLEDSQALFFVYTFDVPMQRQMTSKSMML